MINRRKFVSSLGASTLVPVLAGLKDTPAVALSSGADLGRSRISLGGDWERYFNGTLHDVVSVPSSMRPMGFYSLQRELVLPRLSGHDRAILHFDAITYYGEVFVNGKQLGTMGPYVPYEFDFTDQAKEGKNQIEVRIADLTPTPEGKGKAELWLGVNPGWEAYGGIIRDVYAETRPAAWIENVQLQYGLNADFTRADCKARIFLSSAAAGSGRLEVVLRKGGAVVSSAVVSRAETSTQLSAGASEAVAEFTVEAPALWSPEAPNLYELEVTLTSDAAEDRWRTRTGFRQCTISGNQFLLNGELLVLNGVCRHDMWKEQGFTLTPAQQEQDMRMIKEMGGNFIRLVHYPHDRGIIELADRLGLLVSEEPGYWGVDFTTMPREQIELGYETMERVIRRDWNSPSVFAWLLGNESKLTVEYLKEGKERCRKLDPLDRFVSFANNMDIDKAKPIFEQADLDFFDQHIYTYDLDEYKRTAQFYGDSRPVTFTEWGGRAIGQSQLVTENTVNRLLDLVEAKALAGSCFWSWQDLRQYSRIDDEMVDAVLESGVVTEDREVRSIPYMELGRLYGQRREQPESVAGPKPTLCPLKHIAWAPNSSFSPIDLQSLAEGEDGKKSWGALETRLAAFWAKDAPMADDQWPRTGKKFLLWQQPAIAIAGAPFRFPEVEGYVRPLVLTPEVSTVVIPLNQTGKQAGMRLHILGNVTLPQGYPPDEPNGELAATYTVRYRSGASEEIPIRNGREAARANLIYVATRIDPETTNAQRALLYVKDVVREQYQILLFSRELRREPVQSLSCRLEGKNPFAIFAVTVEAAG